MTMDRQVWIRRLPWFVNIALLLLLVDAVSQLAWQWLTPGQQPQAVTRRPVVSQPVSRTTDLAQQVARYHLFGQADVVNSSGSPTVAPETKLNLVLRGIVSSDNPAEAVAIIATRGGEEEVYNINARLPGGAELQEIYPDRVILKYRGRLETLTLHRKLLSDKELTIN